MGNRPENEKDQCKSSVTGHQRAKCYASVTVPLKGVVDVVAFVMLTAQRDKVYQHVEGEQKLSEDQLRPVKRNHVEGKLNQEYESW